MSYQAIPDRVDEHDGMEENGFHCSSSVLPIATPVSSSPSAARSNARAVAKTVLATIAVIGVMALMAMVGSNTATNNAAVAVTSGGSPTPSGAMQGQVQVNELNAKLNRDLTPAHTTERHDHAHHNRHRRSDDHDQASTPVASSILSESKKSKKEGSSKKPKKAIVANAPAPEKQTICQHPDYTKKTLKTAKEVAMVALFDDLQGEKKFEASDVIRVGSHYLVVYDNLYRIGKVDMNLAFHSNQHRLIPSEPDRRGDSGFEAIVYDEKSDTYLVVVESELNEERAKFHHAAIDDPSVDQSKHEDGGGGDDKQGKPEPEFHAYIEELRMPSSSDKKDDGKRHGYELSEKCQCEFAFHAENKGFEGAAKVRVARGDDPTDTELLVLGLCEGNYCEGGARGREAGNGRMVLMRKRSGNATHACTWETLNVFALPKTAMFTDYSAMALRPLKEDGDSDKNGKDEDAPPSRYAIAVTSQESSAVWLGELRIGLNSAGEDWSLSEGQVLHFPRGADCAIEYCNIEGIDFLDDHLLVAVSDKMKSGGRQDYRCLQKDQSIHTFVLP